MATPATATQASAPVAGSASTSHPLGAGLYPYVGNVNPLLPTTTRTATTDSSGTQPVIAGPLATGTGLGMKPLLFSVAGNGSSTNPLFSVAGSGSGTNPLIGAAGNGSSTNPLISVAVTQAVTQAMEQVRAQQSSTSVKLETNTA